MMKTNGMKNVKNIQEGDEVEIILKKVDQPVNGKVVENNSKKSYIRIKEDSCDTTVRYGDIKSLENFSNNEKINQAAERFADILVATIDEQKSNENKDLLNNSDSDM